MRSGFGFKKEWIHFTRTFRFAGLLISIFSFALANPLMYRVLQVMMQMMNEMSTELAEIEPAMEGYGDLMVWAADMLNQAEMIFSGTLIELCGTSLIIAMLILMAPFGGEQKKRATIIPATSGLDYKYYLLPKFVLYPAVFFCANFLAGIIAGCLCNALFDGNIGADMILLASLLCSVYLLFIITVYMALGLCTSHPGIMTISVYLGQSLVNLILASLGLERYNPFTLYNLISGAMFAEDFSLGKETTSIVVAVVLALVISVLMYVLTLSVLKAKRINNQEDKPEF